MKDLSIKTSTTVFSIFPLLLMSFFFALDQSIAEPNEDRNVVAAQSDSMRTDTIITFNPETFEEVITIVKVKSDSPSLFKTMSSKSKPGTIDTVIIFDPVTKKETITIIKN